MNSIGISYFCDRVLMKLQILKKDQCITFKFDCNICSSADTWKNCGKCNWYSMYERDIKNEL